MQDTGGDEEGFETANLPARLELVNVTPLA
jgi:hypothetical protein